jgi:hypothetical protein
LADLEQLLAKRNETVRDTGVVLPLDDAALWLCSQLKPQPCWVLAGPKGAAVDFALDKGIQVSVAQAVGLSVPRTTVAKNVTDVLVRSGELPIVLRPANAAWRELSRLSKGRNWICATPAELDQALAEWDGGRPLLVQPFIQGNGEGLFGLATEEGVQGWSAHRRLRMMNPHGSGSSACVSQPVDNEIRIAVERLIQKTAWIGLFMVEMLRDRSGMPWFVEINGRPWGSMALSRRQGLEYPAWAATSALNRKVSVRAGSVLEKPVVCRNLGRELMHLLFVLRGPKSKALQEWPCFWRTVLDLLRVRRNDALYNWRRDDLKVFFYDVWYTLRNNLCKPKA